MRKLRKFFKQHFLGLFIISVTSILESAYLYNDYTIHGNWLFQRQLNKIATFQYATEIVMFVFVIIGGFLSDRDRKKRIEKMKILKEIHFLDEIGTKIMSEPSFDKKIDIAVSFANKHAKISKSALLLRNGNKFNFYHNYGFSEEDKRFIEKEILSSNHKKETANNNGFLFDTMDMYDLTGYVIMKPTEEITKDNIETLKRYKRILLPFFKNARLVIALGNNKKTVERLLGRYKLLHYLTIYLQKSSTIEEEYWKLVNIASMFFEADSATVIDVSKLQKDWHFVAIKNTPNNILKAVEEQIKHSDYSGTITEIKNTKKILYIPDTKKYSQWIPAKNSSLSWMGIPIMADDVVVGILSVDGNKVNKFIKENIVFAQALSDVLNSITGRIMYMEKLNSYSVTDSLTGLYNKRELIGRIKEEINRAIRYDRKLSIAIFDLDKFKEWNDTYGHLEGDRLLAEIGKIIKLSVRSSDIPFRFGGDEFIVIFPETIANEAFNITKTFSERLSQIELQKNIKVTFSAGVAEYKIGESAEEFIDRADKALYKSKKDSKEKIKIA